MATLLSIVIISTNQDCLFNAYLLLNQMKPKYKPRLIQLGLQTVTFYLSGLAQSVPLACTERWTWYAREKRRQSSKDWLQGILRTFLANVSRCIYTQDGDNTSYCFSSPPSSSCLSNPGPPVPMHQPLKTENRLRKNLGAWLWRRMWYWTFLKTEIFSSQQVPGMRAGPACCPVKQVQSSVKHIFNVIWLIVGWFEKCPPFKASNRRWCR